MIPSDLLTYGTVLYSAVLLLAFLKSYLFERNGKRMTGEVVAAKTVEDIDNYDPERTTREYYRKYKIAFLDKDGKIIHIHLNLVQAKKVGEGVQLISDKAGKVIKEDHYWSIYKTPIILLVLFFFLLLTLLVMIAAMSN